MEGVAELYITDAEYLDNAACVQALAQRAEDCIKRYCGILQSLRPDGVFDGDSAAGVEALGELVASNLSDILSYYGQSENAGMDSYIGQIAAADDKQDW